MYGRNVYGSTKYGTERNYGLIYFRTFIETVTNTDKIVKSIAKTLATETIHSTDGLVKRAGKFLKETVTSTDSVTTAFLSSYRKTKAKITQFFTRGSIRNLKSNTRIR